MPGIGTIINVVAVIAGGLLGLLFGSRLNDNIQDTIIKGNGVCVLFIGITGALSKMAQINGSTITFNGTVMLVICLAIGGFLGEIIDIEKRFERFGEWLKKKTGNEKDARFVDAFVTTSLIICIGAMAIVGAIQDALMGDISTLVSKSILDLITVMILTASLGKGCLFSFVSVGIVQGSVTLLSGIIKPIMTETALSNISIVGSVLIFCVGLNLIRKNRIRVANMLPSLVLAVAWAFLPFK